MKKLLLIPLLLVACCSIAISPTIQGKVTSYGLYRVSGVEEIIKSPETPSGLTRVTRNSMILICSTNRVPARIGVLFGFEYEINNVPGTNGMVEVTKIAKHPAITKPDGTTSTGFTFVEKQFLKGGRIVSMTGYELDHDYELVAGDWEFEMQFAGQTVCKQKFTVYKE